MTPTLAPESARSQARVLLNKVPEVTIWFWVIKILCTTVGESFADWINMQLGVGLERTAVLFTVILAVVLAVQMRLRQYTPFAYWLTVVVLSVTGTLYTDILTDDLQVRLWISTAAFAAALAVVFGIWYARERTLSIHSIATLPRESFYWLAILVTFALGTAAGDWTLELTGWAPGTAVLLPAALIGAIAVGWRLGANAVLSFWLAYILTRPLGANLGDWLALTPAEHGLGLGTAATTAIFLLAILGTVAYLTVTRTDVVPAHERSDDPAVPTSPSRERALLGYFGAVALVTAGVLVYAAHQPHAAAASDEAESGSATADPAPASGGAPATTATIAPGQATARFPAADVASFRKITQDTLTRVEAGDQAGAKAEVKKLETAWDKDQDKLKSLDATTWTALDRRIDAVLTSVRAAKPDPAGEASALHTLLGALA
jgi:uncharacterized membrane-anchored protein